MPKFRVIQTQEIYRSIEIEADTKEKAEELAEQESDDQFEDDGWGDWYVCPEKTEEIKDE